MADQAAKARAEAIEAFATALRSLRESVGNPSFREMSGRSRAISHTTLHEAAQGYRLPSWATTVEFVKACGADPAQYRERWEQADRASGREPAGPRRSRVARSRPVVAAGDDGLVPPIAPSAGRRRRFALAGASAVGVIAVATVVVVLAVGSGGDAPGDKPTRTGQPAKALSPADCPVHLSNPPFVPAAHTGDASAFVADLTLPDCSHIRPGQTVTKVWRLKNVGKVPWRGYSLRRLDSPQQRNECQTIADVPVDDTAPGHVVDIRAEITAPKQPGFCFARFKMVDAAGRIAFPGTRPVNFQLIVD